MLKRVLLASAVALAATTGVGGGVHASSYPPAPYAGDLDMKTSCDYAENSQTWKVDIAYSTTHEGVTLTVKANGATVIDARPIPVGSGEVTIRHDTPGVPMEQYVDVSALLEGPGLTPRRVNAAPCGPASTGNRESEPGRSDTAPVKPRSTKEASAVAAPSLKSLPNTGVDSWALAAIASVLVAFGSALLLVSRKPRHT